MQHTQFYFVRAGALCALILSAAGSAEGGTIVKPHQPDLLLDGGPTNVCAADVDYAGAIDVNGRAVAPADVGAAPVTVPDEIAVPLHAGPQRPVHPKALGSSPYVSIDGRRLQALVNPKPCPPQTP